MSVDHLRTLCVVIQQIGVEDPVDHTQTYRCNAFRDDPPMAFGDPYIPKSPFRSLQTACFSPSSGFTSATGSHEERVGKSTVGLSGQLVRGSSRSTAPLSVDNWSTVSDCALSSAPWTPCS